ncbi:MAG: sigma 54-interacting transcriptional regulator, partial [Oligoflexia bacterium]|nr:sigma 54-interacting transcriptional regulator [Oligoflexia bacterium]
FAYPFITETMTYKEIDALRQKLIEYGANEHDTNLAIQHLKVLDKTKREYLHELVELVAQEIETFHHEIEKREARILELNSELSAKYRYHSMIGKSREIQQIYHLLEKISRSESTVLIQGENGTGKELAARAIQYSSARKNSVLLAQNCSAFNDNLLDSELF